VYTRWLRNIEEALEAGEDVRPLAVEIRAAFDAIPVDRSQSKPRIGLVGEIYVRCNDFANRFVVRRLESLGAEVAVPPVEEWIDYIDHKRREDLRIDRDYRALLVEHAKEWVKERDVRTLSAPFRGALRDFWLEEHTPAVLARASRYIAPEVRGEAALSIGRAVEYAERGFAGIVNVMPFNCMPGTIVNALMRRFVTDHRNIPYLQLQFDGHEQAGEDLRLEAFVHQARQVSLSSHGESHERQSVEVRR